MWFQRKSNQSSIPTAQMRAVAISQTEAAAPYITHEQPLPVLGANEVRIRVAYAGVNRADLLQRQGTYHAPAGDSPIMGLEVSGTIDAIGERVIGWSLGEPVCALTNGGGYADYVVVPATQILAKPTRIPLSELASLPEACATSYMALVMEADLKPQERVLIHGGASGIGSLMIQIARALGATVFATGSTPAKHAFIQSLGATALAYDNEDFATSARTQMGGLGVDVVIDTLGGPYVAHHLALLNSNGRMVSLACLEGSKTQIPLGRLLMKHIRFSGATLRNRSVFEKAFIMEGVRKRFWPLIAAGYVVPVLDSVHTLSEVENAHLRMENRLNCGKIVLEVNAHVAQESESAAANDNDNTQ